MKETIVFSFAIVLTTGSLVFLQTAADESSGRGENFDLVYGFHPAITSALYGVWRGHYNCHATGYRVPLYLNFSSLAGAAGTGILRSSVLIKEEDGKLRRNSEWFVRATGNWSASISARRISSPEYVSQVRDENALPVGDFTQSKDWLHLTVEDIGGGVMTSSGITNSESEHNEPGIFNMFLYIPDVGKRSSKMERRRLLLTTLDSHGQSVSTYSVSRKASKSESFLSTYRWPLLIAVWLLFMVAKAYMRKSLNTEEVPKRKTHSRAANRDALQTAVRGEDNSSKKDK